MDKKDEKSTNNRTIDDDDMNINEFNGSSSDESRRLLRSGDELGLTERLNEILIEDVDDDLVFGEENVLQWLQALDLQVMGACRADERLKPMLKRNGGSSGVADDCLLAQLSQVRMLLRLCFRFSVVLWIIRLVKSTK